MLNRAHFYSTYDMSIPFNLERADAVVKQYKAGNRPTNINDVIELYNIWLFVDNKIIRKDWDDDTLRLIRTHFKREVVQYFCGLKKETWTSAFKQIDMSFRHFFWDIIDQFGIDGLIDEDTLRDAFSDRTCDLRELLKHERLVNKHQQVVIVLLKENESAAEWLLQEYVAEDSLYDNAKMHFPKTLTFQDKEDIISRYLDNENANLNYVRLVMLAKNDSNLRLSDNVRIKAKRLETKLNEEVLTTGSTVHFKYMVSISSEPDKPLRWVDKDKDENPILCYSKQIMQQFPDKELLHYIRYGFDFLTPIGLIPFVSKDSESDVMERLIGMKGKYAYQTNMAFQYHEAISMLQIEAMQKVLTEEGRSIEDALRVFYQHFLKEEFGYPSGTLSLADNTADWITKCRTIAPEIDAIARRYELYSKTGEVDEEQLRFSRSRVRITNVKSVNPIRYYTINGKPDSLYRLFHMLFSDQSMLTFVDPYKESRYHSFYQLLMAQDTHICYLNYHDYQRRDIDFLIEEGYLSKNEHEMLCVEKQVELSLLKILYEYHSCPLNTYGPYGQEILKEMEKKGWVKPDNHLLSSEERNYFDYYLYNSKYTNSRALRNRYVHGSNVDAKQESIHRNAYNRLLILLALELLKIEDDLMSQQIAKESNVDVKNEYEKRFMIGTIANVGTFSTSRTSEISGEYLTVPKRFGIKEGYVYVNTIQVSDSQNYYIQPMEDYCAEYISFVMNSMLFRTIISQASKVEMSLTIEKIKGISLPFVPLGQQRMFGKLEHLIASLMAKGNERNRDENLQLNVFSSLRDYICLELFPGIITETDIKFILPFTEMMEQICSENKDLATTLINSLFTPGNVVMDNMKKARIMLSNIK